MSKVHLLSPDIVSKIAAGEVIERPASVVKELVENSLDAEALSIEVRLVNAGKSLIHVKDTGSGIEPDDIDKIFRRHSTSKIASLDDLYSIRSLGFRGEALYSIASIADITLRSKARNADSGWEIHIRDGKTLDHRPVNMPAGTEIEVKELFFNTPARRKFLKADSSEAAAALGAFIPYAMLYPQHRFLLTHGNRPLVDLAPADNTIGRAARALNLKKENIIESHRDHADERISIHLLLGDINIQRPRRDMQFVFVNGRPVYSRGINARMNSVYRLIMPAEANPFFAVFLSMPAENVDVNMHPTKREVKIKNEFAILSLIEDLCENALMSYGKAKQINGIYPFLSGETEPLIQRYGEIFPKDGGGTASPSGSEFLLFDEDRTRSAGESPFLTQKETLRNRLASSRYIGNFMNKYLLFETPPALLIIDQHAAQERVTYEKFKKQIDSNQIEVQGLLAPLIISLSAQELLHWEEFKGAMEGIGFATTQWDKESIALHSQPQLINDPEAAVRNILAGEPAGRCDNDTLARRACRSSLMAGYPMKPEEAEELRRRLLGCADPFTCPHGRPAIIEIPEKFLNNQFLR